MSFIVCVTCSVPQGSVLDPLFFILYTANLADRVAQYSVSSCLWWHTTVSPLLSQQNRVIGVIRRPTWALCPGDRPLDVREQTEAQHW